MSMFAKRLRGEMSRWVEAGVITAEQQTSIAALYPAEAESRRVVTLFATLGTSILAVGLFLIISSNWNGIHDWVKIGALVVLLAGVYAGGWWLRIEPGRWPRIGDAVLMLGCLLFMGGIALVSQTFNLNARPPTGVLVWWLGIIAVPWLTRAKGAQFISMAAGLIWLTMELAYSGGWLELVDSHRDSIAEWSGAGCLVGTALLTGGLALRRTSFATFSSLHEMMGLIVLQTSLYCGGFARNGSTHDWEPVNLSAGFVLVGLALAGAAAAAWGNRGALQRLAPWLGLALIPALASLAGFDGNDRGELISVGYWLALLVFDLALIHVALKLGRPGWINLGLAFIAVNIFTRYWDLLGSMMDSGVFFVVSGLVILALAFGFAKGRRRLVQVMREGEA